MDNNLFGSIIYGPVNSRRLGKSLGVNLLPTDVKVCSFDCIYCECGFNTKSPKINFPKLEDIVKALETALIKLSQNKRQLDSITFSGNGEPTLHPNFSNVIDNTIRLRNKYFPNSVITVLTNSTQLHRPEIFNALRKIENPYLKLDSAIEDTVLKIDKPNRTNINSNLYSIEKTINLMTEFNGECVIQTMFLHGKYDGKYIDNTSEIELDLYFQAINKINPRMVTIYTIARNTPAENLEKISPHTLDEIGRKLENMGYKVQISY